MKKIYFLSPAFFLFFVFTAKAQINKGSVLLGGDINFFTQKTTGNGQANTLNGFSISPSIATAVKNNFLLGGFVSINNYNEKNNPFYPFEERKDNGWGTGLFARKYYPLDKGRFSLFLQGTLGYNYMKQFINRGPDNASTTKTSTVNLNCSPGISFKISKKLQLETGLDQILAIQYSHQQYDFSGIIPTHSTTNGFSLNSSISGLSGLYFGLRVLINK